MPAGSAPPGMYLVFSVFSRYRKLIVSMHSSVAWQKIKQQWLGLGHNNTLRQHEEIASLRRQMLVQSLWGQSGGLLEYFREALVVLLCSRNNKIPSRLMYWSKLFPGPLREKNDGHPFLLGPLLLLIERSETLQGHTDRHEVTALKTALDSFDNYWQDKHEG